MEIHLTPEQAEQAAVYLRAMAGSVELAILVDGGDFKHAWSDAYFENQQKLQRLIPTDGSALANTLPSRGPLDHCGYAACHQGLVQATVGRPGRGGQRCLGQHDDEIARPADLALVRRSLLTRDLSHERSARGGRRVHLEGVRIDVQLHAGDDAGGEHRSCQIRRNRGHASDVDEVPSRILTEGAPGDPRGTTEGITPRGDVVHVRAHAAMGDQRRKVLSHIEGGVAWRWNTLSPDADRTVSIGVDHEARKPWHQRLQDLPPCHHATRVVLRFESAIEAGEHIWLLGRPDCRTDR